MDSRRLAHILRGLLDQPRETEWIEFKHNNCNPQEIGQYLSAIANSAALHEQREGYIVWGIEDETRNVIGTSFIPEKEKCGGQELQSWLTCRLNPQIDFRIHRFDYAGHNVVLFQVPAAVTEPISFLHERYIRLGTYKKNLRDLLEKEKSLWKILAKLDFETDIAAHTVDPEDVLDTLQWKRASDLLQFSVFGEDGIISRLEQERFLVRVSDSAFDITNLGAILFARDLSKFPRLSRKSLRVVFYEGDDRNSGTTEFSSNMGYASAFEASIQHINSRLPGSEVVGHALRKEQKIYPAIAIRELVANALIHQDFARQGTGPMVEVFRTRIEITNPGLPLCDTDRLIDLPPQSRNESMAYVMRRMGFCEERGLGIDRVIHAVEAAHLPPPFFQVTDHHTKATLYAPRKLADMDQEERIRACYQHAVLRYVGGKRMNNESLRERLNIYPQNYSQASKIIRDTIERKLIKPFGSIRGKHASYVPIWS